MEARSFVAMANVAIYAMTSQPPLVPDELVSLDVQLPEDLFEKGHRCYFIWLYGKPPDVDTERAYAEQERQRVKQLAARLRALGVEVD